MFWKNKYDGFFKNWEFKRTRAVSGKFCIVAGYGFLRFDDDEYDAQAMLLRGLSFWDKYLLWREFRRETKRRLISLIDTPAGRSVESEEAGE